MSENARSAFEKIKTTLVSTSVLTLPDFAQVFTVKTDVSQLGVEKVLRQTNHSLVFISKGLGPR